MFHLPGHYENFSLRLSEVLGDIGVNERLILKRRRSWLIKESISSNTLKLMGADIDNNTFGSQTEGSTTVGLSSDCDSLACMNSANIMQSLTEWNSEVANLLMIQNEMNVPPGYCRLQLVVQEMHIIEEIAEIAELLGLPAISKDYRGRYLVKNSIFGIGLSPDVKREGPSFPIPRRPGFLPSDNVPAFQCTSWPYQATRWAEQQEREMWPTDELKQSCINSGSFVVGVGAKTSEASEFEFRISTSKAERQLMFSLNLTQIRCYVLMKMILKTYIKPDFPDCLSSFMCKCVLLRCCQNTSSQDLASHTLLKCLVYCLQELKKCVNCKTCPHYLIRANNLMIGKCPLRMQKRLLERLQFVIKDIERAILGILVDDVGNRLLAKYCLVNHIVFHETPEIISGTISTGLMINFGSYMLGDTFSVLLKSQDYDHYQNELYFTHCVTKLAEIYTYGNICEQTACIYMAPLIFSRLGLAKACCDIRMSGVISPRAVEWLLFGVTSDALSGMLLLASALYSVGNMEETERVLKESIAKYNQTVLHPICIHYYHNIHRQINVDFAIHVDNKNEEAVKECLAFCVTFTRAEMVCTPHELKYEMFRVSPEDRQNSADNWMDMAVVDAVPYLLFMIYKTGGRLQKPWVQRQVLPYFQREVQDNPNLAHRETALNLLGQCMEQENRPLDAFQYYLMSMRERPTHNVAVIHLCKLLSKLINNH